MLFDTWETEKNPNNLCRGRVVNLTPNFVVSSSINADNRRSPSARRCVWPCLESMFILLYTPPTKKVCVFSNNAIKRGHEVLDGRAKTNCVISSSPTPGLRTIHLLRSILFRALPSHAIPADSTLCLHLRFCCCCCCCCFFKHSNSGTSSHPDGGTTTAVTQSLRVSPSQRKFPLDFMWLLGPSRWRSLIYLLSCRWWNTHDLKKKRKKC